MAPDLKFNELGPCYELGFVNVPISRPIIRCLVRKMILNA